MAAPAAAGLELGIIAAAAAGVAWCTSDARRNQATGGVERRGAAGATTSTGGGVDPEGELRALRPSALRARARTLGVPPEELEQVEDEGGKEAVVALIASHEAVGGGRMMAGMREAAMDSLRAELAGLRLSELRRRAQGAGLDEASIDEAEDSAAPKSALLELLVSAESGGGDETGLLGVLRSGDVDAVASILDGVADVVDGMVAASSRRDRKKLVALVERLETSASTDLSDLSLCSDGELVALCGALASAQNLTESSQPAEAEAAVERIVVCVARCTDAVVQTVCMLDGPHGGLGGPGAPAASRRLQVLRTVRGLSEERLPAALADEVEAMLAISRHLEEPEGCGPDELTAMLMALLTLRCRTAQDPQALPTERLFAIAMSLNIVERTAQLSESLSGLSLCFAVSMFIPLTFEAMSKSPPDAAQALTGASNKLMREAFVGLGRIRSVLTVPLFTDVLKEIERRNILNDRDELTFACACINWLHLLMMDQMALLFAANDMGIFAATTQLHEYICPSASPLPERWWIAQRSLIDARSIQLTIVFEMGALARSIDNRAEQPWWPTLRLAATNFLKMNVQLEHFDELGGASQWLGVYCALGVIEATAMLESQHAVLLQTDIVEWLEYSCEHGKMERLQTSIRSRAAATLVLLIGRAEAGGKSLSQGTVLTFLNYIGGYFQDGAMRRNHPARKALSAVQSLRLMVVSDANKLHLLDAKCCDQLVDIVLGCLLLDPSDPRYNEDGSDELRDIGAKVLQELSLFGPGSKWLQKQPRVMDSLRQLQQDGSSTRAHESAAAALFELDAKERERISQLSNTTAAAAGANGRASSGPTGVNAPPGQKPPPHIMASYNWDHQDVILRVVASLQDRGYLVWVDTERMKGATVDTMALAVEGSEVVLIGVSRAYKESSNCRMEAQYALQKKKAFIPMMMVENYEADGWLGLLLGTSMWYGFYGDALSSVSAFEDRMNALCREIGWRGHADAAALGGDVNVVPADINTSGTTTGPGAAPGTRGTGAGAGAGGTSGGNGSDSQQLRDELASMRVKMLRQKASAESIDPDLIDDALDSDTPKETLIQLIL